MKRVKFASGKQKTWLQEVKQRSRMTWNDLALFIGVSRATMFNYLAENYLIPLPIIEKLEKFGQKVRAEWIVELREDGCIERLFIGKSAPRYLSQTMWNWLNFSGLCWAMATLEAKIQRYQ
jgi:DNA-binding XRE family transcriptional regulator